MKFSYTALSEKDQVQVLARLECRKERCSLLKTGQLKDDRTIVIVGDRPGPSAPRIPGYHHTPFYSTKHCSGWLNTALHLAKIPEHRLAWVNSADQDGTPTASDTVLGHLGPVIALGGAAAAWLKKSGVDKFSLVPHPQFWKRFKSSQPYQLIPLLHELLEQNDCRSTLAQA